MSPRVYRPRRRQHVLSFERAVRAKRLDEYAEPFPPWIEYVPEDPGQWYLDGHPITAERAAELLDQLDQLDLPGETR